MANPPAPDLLGYGTWHDDDGYHARYKTRLPPSALAAGCLEVVTGATGRELVVAAARNRIRIAAWRTGRMADIRTARERRERRGRP